MTTQEAIEILRDTPIDIRSTREDDIHTLYATAQNMAIEALSNSQKQTDSEVRTSADDVSATDVIYRQDAIDALMEWEEDSFWDDECLKHRGEPYWVAPSDVIERLPSAQSEVLACGEGELSAQSEWNNHTVACLLAEVFNDTCACNYNGIDEWLPEKCELLDSCPNPCGVACWEQFLKHKAERKEE